MGIHDVNDTVEWERKKVHKKGPERIATFYARILARYTFFLPRVLAASRYISRPMFSASSFRAYVREYVDVLEQ